MFITFNKMVVLIRFLKQIFDSKYSAKHSKIISEVYSLTTEMMLQSIKLISNKTVNTHEKQKQKNLNKLNHIKYGNKKPKKDIKYIKVSLLNKGNSFISKHIELIKMTLSTEMPSVMIFCEANLRVNEPNVDTYFKDFNIETKVMPGMDKS